MANHASRTRATSALSLVSLTSVLVTSTLAPLSALAQDSQYVQDYTKKTKTTTKTTTTSTIPKPAAGTTASDKKVLVPAPPAAAPEKETKATTTSTTTAKKDKIVTIVKTTKYLSAGGNKWQQFFGYIILKPGQEQLPLTLNVNNGIDGGSPFRAIRATLAGTNLFGERDWKGKNSLALDMSDALSPGSTQIIFQAFGPAGAAFSWDLTAKSSATVTALNPKSSAPGKNVKATGKLLPTDLKAYQVSVGGKQTTVVSASPEAVEFRVPDGLKPDSKGEVPVIVTISGTKSKPLQLKIALDPEITSFSHVAISSQQAFTIKGKNFGTDAKAVKVTFGGREAAISSVSDDSISVTTPEIENIPQDLSVQVEVNGLKCKQEGRINFTMRNIENSDGYSPFEVPAHLR